MAAATKDEGKTVIKDDVSWKLNGTVPVPTSAKLYLLNELSLERALDINWSNAVSRSTKFDAIAAVYPGPGIRDGRA